MARTVANFSIADVRRVIRLARQEGLPVSSIVIRPDGVAVETRVREVIVEDDEEIVL